MISAPVCSLMMPAAPSSGTQQWGRGSSTLAKEASVPVPTLVRSPGAVNCSGRPPGCLAPAGFTGRQPGHPGLALLAGPGSSPGDAIPDRGNRPGAVKSPVLT